MAADEGTSKVVIESKAKIFINVFASNKKNVQSLEDYIRNEVYKLCSDEEIKLNKQ